MPETAATKRARRTSSAAPPELSSQGGAPGQTTPERLAPTDATDPNALGGASNGPAPDWRQALDAGGGAAPAVDSAQLEAVAQAVESPPGASSGAGAAGSPSPPGPALPSTPQPSGLWSKRKISKAKGSDLRRYVAELQARVPQPGADETDQAVGPAPLTDADKLANLTTALAASFPLAGRAMCKVFRTSALEIDRAESQRLAEAWAPLALPHYDEIVQGIPWAVALGTTYEIGEPKVERMLAERAKRKAEGDAAAAPAADAAAL